MTGTAKTSDVRQRILETADRLFYQDGIRAVGIDRIIAEANVAKMSLYKHFPSKDDLILATLQYREERLNEFISAAFATHLAKTRHGLKALFAALKDWMTSPNFRGCAFQNAAIELADPSHPGVQFARAHKQRFHDYLLNIIKDSVGPRGAKVAPAIGLLIEGAIITAVMQNSAAPIDVARTAALQLLAQFDHE
jgi:AcrR family transcriptional regulator